MSTSHSEGTGDVVTFILRHALLGVGFGCLFAAVTLWLDVGGLWTLLWRSPDWIVALCLLFGGFAVTFGSAVAGTAIMLLPDDST